MAPRRCSINCVWGGELQESNENILYVGGRKKGVICDVGMTLNEFKERVCSKIGIDLRIVDVKLKFKWAVDDSFQVYSLDDDDDLQLVWEQSSNTSRAVTVFVEEIPLSNANINPYIQVDTTQVSMSYGLTPSQGHVGTFTRMLNDENFNIPSPPHVANQHSEAVDWLTQQIGVYEGRNDDIEAEEDVTINDDIIPSIEAQEDVIPSTETHQMGGGNSIVAPTPYHTQIPPFNEYLEDNSWRTWTCQSGHIDEGEFQKGMIFDNKNALLEAIKYYHIKRNLEYITVTSNQSVLALKCKRGCQWRLRATNDLGPHLSRFIIVTYKGPHEQRCVRETLSDRHIHLTSSTISSYIQNCVAKDPTLKVVVIQQMIVDQFKFHVSYRQCWYAKQHALAVVFGDWEESYTLLPQLLQSMQQTNPGTIVEWFHKPPTCHYYTTRERVFQRVFWAFRPCIEGFKFCKPVIAIDGTHLYGKYKHTLLTAIGQDANGQIFPLAFALVEKENTPAWSWFMGCIRQYVTQTMGICVISDRHPGILNTMKTPLWSPPNAVHRLCIRHMASNLNKNFKSVQLKQWFGITAEQRQAHKVAEGLIAIQSLNVEARGYIDDVPIETWSICHDGGYRYGIKTTNVAECFNWVLKGVRFLPITALVEFTFYRVNQYFVARREMSLKLWQDELPYPPNIHSDIQRNMEKAKYHEVTIFDISQGIYQVKTGRGGRSSSKGGKLHKVNLNDITCTCNKLTIFHYPCSHVLAVCRKMHLSEERFVHRSHTSWNYLKAYEELFMPLMDRSKWGAYTGVIVIPDKEQARGLGRPKSKRIINEMDEQQDRRVSCSFCHRQGHNKRRCPLMRSRGDGAGSSMGPTQSHN